MSASASAAACPATSASVTAARNVTVTHKRAGDVLPALYSSNVLERLYEKVSNTDEPPRHEANHRSVHERFSARTKSLVIFAHPPVLADPSDRPLHHPPTR
jgi:hypothetical protein